MLDNTTHLHQSISCELGTPVAKLPQLTLDRMLKFVDTSRKEVTATFKNFVKEQNTTVTKAAIASYQDRIDGKYIFSDLGAVEVYVPSMLIAKPVMLEYSKMLLESLQTVETILDISAEEAAKVIDRFIARPKDLADFSINTTLPETLLVVDRRINKIDEGTTDLVSAKNVKDRRRFKETYLRMADYYATMNNAQEIHALFYRCSVRLEAFKKQVDHINERVNRLLGLINTDPNYSMGSVAAIKIINVSYQFAREAEFVGKTMFNSNVFLKSIRDTNLAINDFLTKSPETA